ncbi:MAG: PTS mannitol transporter subunit IICB [Erysipelotrichaceae bacterium]|nr:PTS mannitol transporter subunit IICB [Erysipelotrichaceae bacterium]
MREKIQVFGRFLSSMVMPNIGAFIAWGFITALFIPTGWTPNENLAALVGPMIVYLLPVLIGYTGGRIVHGTRGAVVGAVATMGVIVGSSVPMFIGAMIVGPATAWLMKKFDQAVEGKVPGGFEMLVNNFSLGLLGLGAALVSYIVIGPTVQVGIDGVSAAVESVVNAGLLPLVSILVEPAKVLFLNNALNHGIFGPLGVNEVAEAGKSIFFLIETNPGPGLGILVAYFVFGKGLSKQSAPGSMIIHFLGGIHEIYFPYVLMNPLLVLAVIAGGAAGVLTFSVLGAGLVATPSPGSIFALAAMAPRGGLLPVLIGITVAAAVSFLVAAVILKFTDKEADLEVAKAQVKDLKGNLKQVAVKKIVFACDAGMGSSAMGATTLRKKVQAAGLDIEVIHKAIEDIPADCQIVVTHESLAGRAKAVAPQAEIVAITNFVGAPEYDQIVARLVK